LIRIQRATKRLHEAWHEACEHWDDQTRREFEQRYIAPLGSMVTFTVGAIQKVTKTLEDAQRDCDDEA
jgi:hypothetical protein